jgi:aspartyl/asparaginyl beta-hydroxylase (cupin superfamily)
MSFLSASDFPFLRSLEARWEQIRAEYDALASQATEWHEPIHNGKWSVIGFRFQDQDLPENRIQAPVTCALCDAIPRIHTYGFSIMEPGCEIEPHVGYTNEVLRGHLGLYSNPGAALQVGEEIKNWHEGEVFVFDDTTLHAAWNRGESRRVILLFDFYKP